MFSRKPISRSTNASNRIRQASLFALEGLEDRRLLSVSLPAVAHHHHHHHRHSQGAQVTPGFIRFRGAGAAKPSATTSPTGLSPSIVRHAYGIDQVMFGGITGDGAGQTIAIVDAYDAPNIAADLHTFNLTFGLPDTTFTKVGQTGTSSLPGTDPSGRGNSWAVETSLDVEWAHAVAPKANILLVEANSAYDSDLFAAINTARRWAGVSAISLSWGGGESSSQSSYDSYFTTPSGHNGVTFIASSGDSGAYDYNATSTRAVEYPASSPNILSVGGTRLNADSAGNYLSESGWGNGTSSGTAGGSGGGISAFVSQPAYQQGIVTQTSTRRAVPDVAFDADPASGVSVIDTWDSPSAPWMRVGGTSLAAPMWAGVIAITNQGRALSGQATLDGATQTLPKIYALPASDFHDITTGNNGYPAGPGYDLVTGRGTPIVNKLVPDLVGSSVVIPTPTIAAMSVSPNSVTTGASVTLTATGVQESGGSISSLAFYRESNGVAGLQVGSDTSLGNGAANGTTYTLTTSTTGLSAGSYTYYALATDPSARTATAAAGLTVTAPVVTPANNNFASAIAISGTAATVTGSNINATKEAGEPNHAGFAGGKSVWWTWTAPASAKVNLTTAGSSFDTLLAVYTGSSVSALTGIASNDDNPAGGTRTSALSFNAVAGTTYRIAVDGYAAASGNITLALSTAAAPVAPANDNFANATGLTGASLTTTGTNVNATMESGEPAHAGVISAGASVWYTWTAPTTKTVSLNTAGSSFDTILAVYTGNAVSGLTKVAANDDSGGGLTSAVSFNAVAGTTYRIAVAGYRALTGNIVLNLA